MKTQLRIMAALMGVLASGATISGNTQSTRLTMIVNSSANAGIQGIGGQVISSDSVTDSSCNIDSGSTDQTADLGKWASSYFTGTGSETTKTSFHIKVRDCPASMAKVAVLFDGARDQSGTTLLTTNDGATGVAIKLYEDDQSMAVSLNEVPKDHPVIAGVTVGTGSVGLEFYAGYASTGTMAAGGASGMVSFNTTYN